MIIDHSVIHTLLLKLPLCRGKNDPRALPGTLVTESAVSPGLKLYVARGLKPARNPLSVKRSRFFPLKILGRGEAVGFEDSDEFAELDVVEQNELQESSINPLQIGYRVEDFEVGVPELDIDSNHGGGDDGEGNDGANGRGGDGGEGPGGSEEGSDGLEALEWWWLWQWNRAIRARKRSRTTLHFSYNDRNQLIALAVQILAKEVMPPRDMIPATLLTLRTIEDLLPRLFELLLYPIILPLVLFQFQESEHIFAATLYGMLGASVMAATVFSGAVIYGLWRWHNSFQNGEDHDSNEDNNTDPQSDDPPVQ